MHLQGCKAARLLTYTMNVSYLAMAIRDNHVSTTGIHTAYRRRSN